MANIQNELNNIKTALYGKDVRNSIHDGIDVINKEVENTTGRQVDLENIFDQLVINAGNSNAEIVDARVKSDGTSYSKLGDRLNEVDSRLAHIIPYCEKKDIELSSVLIENGFIGLNSNIVLNDNGVKFSNFNYGFLEKVNINKIGDKNGIGLDLFTNSYHNYSIRDIRIDNFDTGLKIGGSWIGHFSNINILNCYTGINLESREGLEPNSLSFIGCNLNGGNTGYLINGTSYGINITGGDIEHFEVGIHIKNCKAIKLTNVYLESNKTDIIIENSNVVLEGLQFSSKIKIINSSVKINNCNPFNEYLIDVDESSTIEINGYKSIDDYYRMFSNLKTHNVVGMLGCNFLGDKSKLMNTSDISTYYGEALNVQLVECAESNVYGKNNILSVRYIASNSASRVFIPLQTIIKNNEKYNALIRYKVVKGNWEVGNTVFNPTKFDNLKTDGWNYCLVTFEGKIMDNIHGVTFRSTTNTVGDEILIDYICCSKKGIPVI